MATIDWYNATFSAGNSTAITILTTMLRPSAGVASNMGRNIAQDKDAVRLCIAIFRDAILDSKLIGSEIPDLHAWLHGMNRDKSRKRMDEVLDLINMRENEGLMSEWQHRWRTS